MIFNGKTLNFDDFLIILRKYDFYIENLNKL